jgi:hypothetical protein
VHVYIHVHVHVHVHVDIDVETGGVEAAAVRGALRDLSLPQV